MNTKIDEKIYWIQKIMTLPLNIAPYLFYPRIYKITDVGENVISFILFSLGVLGSVPRKLIVHD